MSAFDLDDTSSHYGEWRSELCPKGLQTEDDPNPKKAQELIGLTVMDRAAPSLLDKDTMFYSYTNWDEDFAPSCIWRATATGNYPDKKWTEDLDPVYCTTADELRDGGIYSIDPAAFFDAEGKPWMTFGSHFSGIWVV